MNLIQKKLKISKAWVSLHGWDNVALARDAIRKGHLKVVKTQPEGPYAHLGPAFDDWEKYDIMDKNSVQTYGECVSLRLDCDEKVELVIFDGDNMDGQPTTHRVTFTLEGAWWEVKDFVAAVEHQFAAHCMRQVLRQEELARIRKATKLGDTLLAKFAGQLEDEDE